MAFACSGSDAQAKLKKSGHAVVDVRCMGQLPPSFLDYVLSRDLADSVLLAGCGVGDCRYRYGVSVDRAAYRQEARPQIAKRVDNQKIAYGWQSDAPTIEEGGS